MRRPPIVRLFRGVLCATISLSIPPACSVAQTTEQTTIETISRNQRAPASDQRPGDSSVAIPPDLPDSPGTVLRRRLDPQDGAEQTASLSGSAMQPVAHPDQLSAAPSRQRLAPLTAAEAEASDAPTPAGCPAVPGPPRAAARYGIVEPRNASVTPDPSSATSAGNPAAAVQPPDGCPPAQNPYQRFLNSTTPIPLTPKQKAYLAVHNFIEPGNIVTILGTSGIAIASDAHTAYGPGWRGFGRNAGISFVQDATGDFFGTFLIPSIAHEDPHYHRMPNASIPRRTLHAISRTVIAQSDYGRPMLNYSTLLNYPITAEIANLYVPGVATNGPSTAERILTGYATDPIDNLITEFLPDVARRVHVRVIFVQQIINQVAAGQPINMFP